jgi:hypothetical protein
MFMSYSISEAISKVLFQYRNSPKVLALIRAFIAEYPFLSEVIKSLETRLDIDLSEGVQLDGIGEIVGRPRPLTEEIKPDDVFTFLGADGLGFSSLDRPDIGGRFQGLAGGIFLGPMPDADYRILLRATIYANHATSTVDSLSTYVLFVLGVAARVYTHVGWVDMTFQTPVNKVWLKIIDDFMPIAAGIGLRYLAYTNGPLGFGFRGAKNSGFGSIAVEQTGSGFAGLLNL